MSSLSHSSPFDELRRERQDGTEYWSARDLAKILGYNRWENFQNVLPKAKAACAKSGHEPADHFRDITKMVQLGSRAKRKIEDVELSRYACYLIVQNSDPAKPIVALGQTYFAVQTRRQELADELAALPEEQKRLILRSEMAVLNSRLAAAAQQAGVIQPFDFALFQDHGYRGLCGIDLYCRGNIVSKQYAGSLQTTYA